MAIGNMHKNFGEDRTCSSKDTIVDRQTHAHRHAHHNTLLRYRGWSNNNDNNDRLTAFDPGQPG